MTIFACALSFLAASGDPDLPAELSIDVPRSFKKIAWQEEPARPPQDATADNPQPFVEYVIIHSELELGMLYTNFAGDLGIENDTGAFLRYGVDCGKGFLAGLEYRHYDFDSSDPVTGHEGLLIRGLMAGAGWRQEVVTHVEANLFLWAGMMKWESHDSAFRDEPGWVGSAEGGFSVRIHEAARIRVGFVLDTVKTDFHQDHTHWDRNIAGLVGFELRG